MTEKNKTKTPPELAKVRRAAAQAKVDALKASASALEARQEAVTEELDITDPNAVIEASTAILAAKHGLGIVTEALERANVVLHRSPVWQSDRPRLAQALAEVLGNSIMGTAAKATFSVPTGEVGRPEVYVEQGEPDTMTEGGAISGSAKVVVLFPSWMGDTSTAETSKLVLKVLRDSGRVRIPATNEQLLVGSGAASGGRCTLRLRSVVVLPETEGDAA